MDTNIDMSNGDERSYCRDTQEFQLCRAFIVMGSSTTQRSTTPNRTKYATRMTVSIISKDELGQRSNAMCHGESMCQRFTKRSDRFEKDNDGIRMESATEVRRW